MPLFTRSSSRLQIPPVESTSTSPNHSASSDSNLVRDKYSRSNGVGDVYTRGGLERRLDQDRNELFAGYNPARAGSSRFFEEDSVEEEEDVEGIRRKIAYKKQESVNSTQNSLRLAREAVETGNNTLKRLGEQSERLVNTELYLDRAKGHSKRADDKTEELRKLNRSIFIPAVTFNNDAKHAAREAEVQRRYEEKRAGRGEGIGYQGGREGVLSGGRHMKSTDRSRFQFEANASDDEMEDTLERNLDEIQGLVRELKGVSLAMGTEIDRQSGTISVLEEKTVKLDARLYNNTINVHKAGGK